jgi:hypothetical protein
MMLISSWNISKRRTRRKVVVDVQVGIVLPGGGQFGHDRTELPVIERLPLGDQGTEILARDGSHQHITGEALHHAMGICRSPRQASQMPRAGRERGSAD